jgi:hypothetical protein
MDPRNPRAPFHLPLLHTLVEERAGVRRFPFQFMFMGRIRRRISRMDPRNPRASFHLPLLHTLVEERAGVRRFMFMGRGMRRWLFAGPMMHQVPH